MTHNETTETISFSGSKETRDISDITELKIDEMHGADGGAQNSVLSGPAGTGGSGGYISGAVADVSSYGTLEIWVGEAADTATAGWGKSDGGDGNTSDESSGGGGGSTELWVDNTSTLVAVADAGGGGAGFSAGDNSSGGGGARCGDAGSTTGSNTTQGSDAQCPGSGFGGDGGDIDNFTNTAEDGDPGGQERGIASGGSTTTGGSKSGDGEITLTFVEPVDAVEWTPLTGEGDLEDGTTGGGDLDSGTAGDGDLEDGTAGSGDLEGATAGEGDLEDGTSGSGDVEQPTSGDTDINEDN